ncbi:MAG: hypothetical protein JNN09_07040 [Alphaproteobacteria bacterium]|nr:hypothetical protein [Alphaproteobacteria bacterium]
MNADSLKIFYLPNAKKRFDLPLQMRMGTEFLVLLIALMTLLSMLSAAASFALDTMSNKWTSGLETNLSIEIQQGETSKDQRLKIVDGLKKLEGVSSVKLLGAEDMQALLGPWLGDVTTALDDLPLPTLITVEITQRSNDVLGRIGRLVHEIAPKAKIDSHEAWLGDLLKLTRSLKFAALVIMTMIIVVTAIVVGGAVRSRMAIHQKDLELLHVMGATDKYITNQFMGYILWLAGKGSLFGIGVGAIILSFFQILAWKAPETVPTLTISPAQWAQLLLVPALILGVSLVAARRTALQVLEEMP